MKKINTSAIWTENLGVQHESIDLGLECLEHLREPNREDSVEGKEDVQMFRYCFVLLVRAWTRD